MTAQLNLLQPQQPLTFEPTKGRKLARCGFTGEAFGGIFSDSEAQSLLEFFASRTEPITPAEFGAAAALAVRQGAKKRPGTISSATEKGAEL